MGSCEPVVRGVVCAGGSATRLGEATRVANKHLLPVGDRPMIYYPLEMLQVAGISEVCLISGPDHAGQFIDLLQDGQINRRGTDEPLFNLDITYRVQAKPGGIAQAISLAENFANCGPILVVLGDNLTEFSIRQEIEECRQALDHARIFLYKVKHPEQYGVAVFEAREHGVDLLSEIVEKPTKEKGYEVPPSYWAVTGIYFFPADVFNVIRTLEPSERGEYEVTDINQYYLKAGRLDYSFLTGWWEDAGESPEALPAASKMVLQTGANKPLPTDTI